MFLQVTIMIRVILIMMLIITSVTAHKQDTQEDNVTGCITIEPN